MDQDKNKGGYTLIELLIYTVVFALAVGVFSGVLVTFTRLDTQTSADAELTQQLAFVQSTIQQLVRASVNIQNAAGVASTSLVLRMTSSTLDPTIISSDANGIYLQQGTGAVIPLTNSQVKVSQFQATKYENPDAHAIVQVDISLAYNTSNPYQQITRKLSLAIGRVSAATFDDNLVPNVDASYSLGTASTNRWKDLNISNLLNVGTLTTDPVAGSQNGSIYYNTSSSAFRGYVNGAWANLGSLWTASGTAIYYNSGNVGIGTATPQAALHVYGSGDEEIRVESTGVNRAGRLRFINNAGGLWYVGAGAWDGSSNLQLITSVGGHGGGINIATSGNVGIGIDNTSPSYTLDVTGTFRASATSTFSGNVGIGTTTPGVALDVQGTVRSTAFSTTGGYTQSGTSANLFTGNVRVNGYIYSAVGNNSYTGIQLNTGTNNMTIGIGTSNGIGVLGYTAALSTAAGTAVLSWKDTGIVQMNNYGAGTATFDASGNISSASDERLKNIQGDLKYGLKEILQIHPILFKWNKESGLETNHVYTGFSAQEIQKLIPETVGQNKDGYLTLSDRGIEGALVNADKELNNADKELNNEIESLKTENDALKAALCQLNPKAEVCR